MRVKISDIAKLAGVSVAAVSLALNNKNGVSDETRQHIINIAESLNYMVNDNARNLKSKKTFKIGLVVTDIRNPFFATVVDELALQAKQMGYVLQIAISNDSIKKEQEAIKMFVSNNTDGIIIVPTIDTNIGDMSHILLLKNLKIDFVFCTSAYLGFDETCVMTDLAKGEYELVKYLLERGKRKIFLITGDSGLLFSKMRIQGYISAFQDSGYEFSKDWIIETKPYYESGYEQAKIIWEKRPDAVITVNDFVAIGLIKGFKDMGVRVPEDINVAGYDDLLFSSLIETSLTTVRQPIQDICKRTLEVLIDKIDNKSKSNEFYLLEPKLEVRESTD